MPIRYSTVEPPVLSDSYGEKCAKVEAIEAIITLKELEIDTFRAKLEEKY